MKKILVILALVTAFPVHALDVCELQKKIYVFAQTLSPTCDESPRISIQEITHVYGDEGDHTIIPSVKEGDIRVKASVNLCEVDDNYFIWLRKIDLKYSVVTYTSFSQPE